MRERLYLVTVLFLAAGMFVGLRLYLQRQQAAALATARDVAALPGGDSPASRPSRPVAEVAELLRRLKLVTVEIRTDVESARVDESWRGDVRASVTAPVRLYYGCDLTEVVGAGTPAGNGRGAGLRPDVLTQGYTLRVPRPVRLAVEVEGDGEQTDVRVGWGRFRDLAGEYQLGLARTGLYREARSLRLRPGQQRQVEQATRDQLIALVRALAAGGDPVHVGVEFIDAGDGDDRYVSVPGEPAATGGRE